MPVASVVGLQGFERRLERMVEGAFARAFKSGLRPVELGRRLVREMDDNRSVDVRGRTVVPNHFTVQLVAERPRAVRRHPRQPRAASSRDAAREHARDEGYAFLGPVEVELVADERLHTGAFQIDGPHARGRRRRRRRLARAAHRRPLRRSASTSVTRRPPCPSANIVLADPNVSRNHAEIRPQGDGFVVVDLGSTNGTRVNGVRVAEQRAAATATSCPSATPACASRPPESARAQGAP